MDFDLPSTIPVSGIPWERVVPPLLPRLRGTFGSYSWTPAELLIPVKEHAGAAQVGQTTSHFIKLNISTLSEYKLNTDCSKPMKPNH